MEIEIESKRNNPLLNRTEVYFIVKHPGEGTPNREIIRSELAEKLNVKKENIIVNTVQTGFGTQKISGYAKVYSSLQKTKELEQDYILARNKLIEVGKKEKKGAAPAPGGESAPKPSTKERPEEASKPLTKGPIVDTSEPTTDKPIPNPEQSNKTTTEYPPKELPKEKSNKSDEEKPVDEPREEEKSTEEHSDESKVTEKTKEERKEE